MDITAIISVLMVFSMPIAIVALIVRGPKARAQAEIMKASALAELEGRRSLSSAVDAEETRILMGEQEKRIESLEGEIAFMKRLLEDKTGRN